MLFAIFFIVVVLFSFVLIFGAPYLPTKRAQASAALDLLDLKPGQTLYELGCGDGRVMRLAAERGLNAVGYELNPLLALIARIYTWRYRKQVRIVCANFWSVDISKADGVFVFLLDRFMARLDGKMHADFSKPIKLASFAFKIPGRAVVAEKDGIFLYQYK